MMIIYKIFFAFIVGLASLCVPMDALAADGLTVSEIITYPVVEGILCAVILLSLLAELKTAGFSGGALVAALAGCILIGAHGEESGGQVMEFSLYFGGLFLLLMDILFLFSGAVAAVGLVCIMAGLFFSLGGNMAALYVLSAALVLAAVGGYFLAGHLSESQLWQKITLRSKLSGKEGFVSSVRDLSIYEGKEGTAVSVLRPAGKVEVEGHILDAVSQGTFIEKGMAIVVKKAEGNHLVVRLKE